MFVCAACSLTLRELSPADFPFHCACGTRYVTLAEARERMAATRSRHAARGGQRPLPAAARQPPRAELSPGELAELFPAERDPTLLGERVKALTDYLGIPPCGGCGRRREWLNQAHAWLRDIVARP